jgi:hypothetical protein
MRDFLSERRTMKGRRPSARHIASTPNRRDALDATPAGHSFAVEGGATALSNAQGDGGFRARPQQKKGAPSVRRTRLRFRLRLGRRTMHRWQSIGFSLLVSPRRKGRPSRSGPLHQLIYVQRGACPSVLADLDHLFRYRSELRSRQGVRLVPDADLIRAAARSAFDRAKGGLMRALVQPPPVSRCDRCHGELRFKCIKRDGPMFELECEIFVCIKCGHEKSYRASSSPYASPSGSHRPSPKVG